VGIGGSGSALSSAMGEAGVWRLELAFGGWRLAVGGGTGRVLAGERKGLEDASRSGRECSQLIGV